MNIERVKRQNSFILIYKLQNSENQAIIIFFF